MQVIIVLRVLENPPSSRVRQVPGATSRILKNKPIVINVAKAGIVLKEVINLLIFVKLDISVQEVRKSKSIATYTLQLTSCHPEIM